MFKSYMKVALRGLKRHKGYSFINITGLAIGMACCLLICLWVLDELSFDRFHADVDRLYRVEFDQNYSGKDFHVTVTQYPMARALEAELPEIEEAVRYSYMGEQLVRYEQTSLYEDDVFVVDPAFLEIFSFPLLQGDPKTALNEPKSAVISQDMADRYFGGENPIGKTLNFNNRTDLQVTGILKKIPANSSLQFQCLLSFKLVEQAGTVSDSWNSNNVPTYVRLKEGASAAQMGPKILDLVTRHTSNDNPTFTEDLTYALMPLTRIHLYSHFGFYEGPKAAQYVYIFSVVAFLVLLIACINFMNLSTARSAKRAKEVGIRKVVGAVRGEIIRQFYAESLLFTLVSLVFALGLVGALLHPFNAVTGKSISLDLFSYWQLLLGLAGVALFTGWISGSYPALFLGSFQPIRTLRGKLKSGPKSKAFRRLLVVVQFTLSISLIIGTGVVYSQLNFLKSKNLGFEQEHAVYIPMRGVDRGLYAQLKTELSQSPELLGVSGGRSRPSRIGSNTDSAVWEGKDPEMDVSTYMTQVDYDFFETMGIEFVEGRSFSKEFPTDEEAAYIINEELVKVMGVASAENMRFGFEDMNGQVIGVVKNFHFLSLKQNIEPLVITLNPTAINYIVIRLTGRSIPSSLAFIEETWKRIVPNFPFEYRFMNEDFDARYRSEMRMGDILKYFAGFAVFIACLGLLGLASFAAEQRTKEIGIRKVLGASSPQIGMLIYKEFILLLGAANLVAWPISYLVMRGWLQDFAYRTGMSVAIYVLAAAAAALCAFVTVSYQALKASQANPVKALRYE
jgi:putative ABC transport system permease protein